MQDCSKCGAQNVDGANFCNNCAAPLKSPVQGTAPQQASQPVLPPQLQPGQKASLLDYLSHYQGLQVHWAKRFVAILLDSIFVVAPVYVILAVFDWWTGWLWFTVVAGIILFLYSAFFEEFMSATIGKAIVGLKVISVEGKLELPSTLIRNVTKVFTPLLLLEFIVTLVVQTTDAHQKYTDRIAKTTVVEKRP